MAFDVNPQMQTFIIQETVAGTFTQLEIPLPTVHDLGNGKALVVELIKIFSELSSVEIIDGTTVTVGAAITKQSKAAMPTLSDPDCFWRGTNSMHVEDTAATDATLLADVGSQSTMKVMDYTDGNGNGMLIGARSLFVQVKSTDMVGKATVKGKLFYRMKKVSATELIGIISE